jgi:hypothetical protein
MDFRKVSGVRFQEQKGKMKAESIIVTLPKSGFSMALLSSAIKG